MRKKLEHGWVLEDSGEYLRLSAHREGYVGSNPIDEAIYNKIEQTFRINNNATVKKLLGCKGYVADAGDKNIMDVYKMFDPYININQLTGKERAERLNQYTQSRIPDIEILWKESNYAWTWYLEIQGQKVIGLPFMNELGDVYMDGKCVAARIIIDELEAWIAQAQIEEMPKLLGTELEPLARIALERGSL